ncbi:MAG TPA: hypothetical protein VFR12_12830 [Pyrinomonadaceae bacterium]|nr:hypothetical protein [Pyrinomonadaceae bacterium]
MRRPLGSTFASCKSGEKDPVTVFMDMYHDHVEKEPVPGFTIVNNDLKA